MGTGIIRRVDDLGRVAIPKALRQVLSISEGTPLEFSVQGNAMVVKPYRTEEQQIREALAVLKQAAKNIGMEDSGCFMADLYELERKLETEVK